MENKVNYTLVGLFVILLGAALISVLLWLTARGDDRSYETYRVYTSESVAGLNLKATVNYRGVEVGRVTNIRLDPDNPELVELTLEIEQGTPIREDTRAILVTKGLTGLASIDLTGGSLRSPALVLREGQKYPEIINAPSLASRLDNGFTDLLARAVSLSERLEELLDKENQDAFSALLVNLAATSKGLAEHQESMGRSLDAAAATLEQSTRLAKQLEPLLTELQRTSQSLGQMGQSLDSAGGTIQRRVDQLSEALLTTNANLNQTILQVRAELTRMGSATQPELTRLLGEMGRLGDALSGLTADLRRDPRVLLYGKEQARPGPGE